jgi:hypothetical protein
MLNDEIIENVRECVSHSGCKGCPLLDNGFCPPMEISFRAPLNKIDELTEKLEMIKKIEKNYRKDNK